MNTSLPSQASLPRRLACLVYDGLLLLTVLFIASFLVVGLLPEVSRPWSRGLYQLYLLLVAGAYFVWAWRRGGQTLAMQTWRIRLVSQDGAGLTLHQAWRRYLFAVIGAVLLGLGFLWALWDRDRQFLHDRLAGTRLIVKP